MKNSVFEYRDYKEYLRDTLSDRAPSGRGERSRIAEAANCHTAYVSQVLNGNAHFSLEQADLISRYLGHTRDQTSFFLLLVQHNRAGTQSLRAHFEAQMQNLVEKQLVLKNRLDYKRILSREDQMTFYSSWHYGAIHVLVSVPGCSTAHGISKYLGIPIEKTREVLQFLASVGLAIEDADGKYRIGATHIHLEDDSPMISKHHANWRMRTIAALDDVAPGDLHYSSVITASKADAIKIKTALVKTIEEVRAVVRPSRDEDGFCYTIDFFGLRKPQG